MNIITAPAGGRFARFLCLTSMASACALTACNEAPQEAPKDFVQTLCKPEVDCPDPPDKPERPLFYPARGWTVFDASAENVQRGVKWWAYLWQGNTLLVKGYYPEDFGAGRTSDPYHVSIRITVHSATAWQAETDLYLPTVDNATYTDHQYSRVVNEMGNDGVLRQTIALKQRLLWGDHTEIVGNFEDDGTGNHVVWGEDSSRGTAAQALFSFLNDFNGTGALLMPPDISMTCDEGCSNGYALYLERASQFAASRGANLDCAIAAGTAVVCVGGSILLALSGPPGWGALLALGVVCGGAFESGKDCIRTIGQRSSGGACVSIGGPETVVGPDGSITRVDGVIVVNKNHCEF